MRSPPRARCRPPAADRRARRTARRRRPPRGSDARRASRRNPPRSPPSSGRGPVLSPAGQTTLAPVAHRVVLIPGDGTGPELTEATRRALEATGVEFDWDVREAGADVMEKNGGNPLPPDVLDAIRQTGVALKGPITRSEEHTSELQSR